MTTPENRPPDTTNPAPNEPATAADVGARTRTRNATAPSTPLLYTPAQAATMLAITESWLRRKAGLRLIPCTFVGKHLRFSDADLQAIVAAGNRLAGTHPRRARRTRRRPPKRSH